MYGFLPKSIYIRTQPLSGSHRTLAILGCRASDGAYKGDGSAREGDSVKNKPRHGYKFLSGDSVLRSPDWPRARIPVLTPEGYLIALSTRGLQALLNSCTTKGSEISQRCMLGMVDGEFYLVPVSDQSDLHRELLEMERCGPCQTPEAELKIGNQYVIKNEHNIATYIGKHEFIVPTYYNEIFRSASNLGERHVFKMGSEYRALDLDSVYRKVGQAGSAEANTLVKDFFEYRESINIETHFFRPVADNFMSEDNNAQGFRVIKRVSEEHCIVAIFSLKDQRITSAQAYLSLLLCSAEPYEENELMVSIYYAQAARISEDIGTLKWTQGCSYPEPMMSFEEITPYLINEGFESIIYKYRDGAERRH